MLNTKRFLFVISGSFINQVGGHLLSAISIANFLGKHSNETGILVHSSDLLDYKDASIIVYNMLYNNCISGHLRRSLDVYNVLRNNPYEAIVAMDSHAVRDSVFAAIALALPLVQVRAGGPVGCLPPLQLPGQIVFSRELLENLQSVHNVSNDNIIYSPGRIDFDCLLNSAKSLNDVHSMHFDSDAHRILAISRLSLLKADSILNLFKQVEEAAKYHPLQLRVVGDGEAKSMLMKQAQMVTNVTSGKAQIEFLGSFRVSPSDLTQADLVVGQGRTVLEAIASGVPAAVCGNNAYLGLLTSDNFDDISYTNLSSRGFSVEGCLSADLHRLTEYRRKEFPAIRRLAHDIYDVRQGGKAMKQAVDKILEQYPTSRALRWHLLKAYSVHLLSSVKLLTK